MRLLTATLRIYVDAAKASGKAFARSAWALALLLVCFPVLTMLAIVVAPLGFLGGVVQAIAQAALAGTYLATLRDALHARRSMGVGVVRANLGASTWDIVNVLFPLWVVDLVLSLARAPSIVPLVFGIAVFLFLNPAPELVGRTRAGGLELLREAWEFMSRNGPEWLVPQVALLGLAWLALPDQALALVQLFGPRFGFTHAGSLAVAHTPAGWALGFVLVAGVHLVMLFRGALFELLSGGGRRAREWEERFR